MIIGAKSPKAAKVSKMKGPKDWIKKKEKKAIREKSNFLPMTQTYHQYFEDYCDDGDDDDDDSFSYQRRPNENLNFYRL